MYLLPHPALRSWISNYTITFPNTGMMSDRYAVIPHGSTTLVFSCQEGNVKGGSIWPDYKACSVGAKGNDFDLLFIVEFQPAGYYAFSRMPQKELTDLVLHFEDVNPALHRPIVQRLEESVSIDAFIVEVEKMV